MTVGKLTEAFLIIRRVRAYEWYSRKQISLFDALLAAEQAKWHKTQSGIYLEAIVICSNKRPLSNLPWWMGAFFLFFHPLHDSNFWHPYLKKVGETEFFGSHAPWKYSSNEIIFNQNEQVFKTWLHKAPGNLVWSPSWPWSEQEVGLDTFCCPFQPKLPCELKARHLPVTTH